MNFKSHTFARMLDHELLTREESLALSVRIKKGTVPPARKGDVVAYSPDAEAAAYSLVQGNMRYIARVVRESGVEDAHEFEDLVSASVPFALRAARTWNPVRSASFLTVLAYWVRAAISDYRRRFSHGITSLSGYQRDWLSKVRQARERLAKEMETEPTQNDVIEATNLPPEKVIEFWERPFKIEIDAGHSDVNGSSSTLLRLEAQMGPFIVEDPVREAVDLGGDGDLARKVMTGALTDREREIMSLCYGLEGDARGMSLTAVGAKVKVTRERVRQIHAKSLRKLRSYATQLRKAEEGDVGARHGLTTRRAVPALV
jgi:RNA polymerase sigma factor (sigma-70 family)